MSRQPPPPLTPHSLAQPHRYAHPNTYPSTLIIGASTIILILSSACLLGLYAPTDTASSTFSTTSNPPPPPINKSFTYTILTLTSLTILHSLIVLGLLIFKRPASTFPDLNLNLHNHGHERALRAPSPVVYITILLTSFLGSILWSAIVGGTRIYVVEHESERGTSSTESEIWRQEKLPVLTLAGTGMGLVGYLCMMCASGWVVYIETFRRRRGGRGEDGVIGGKEFRQSSTSTILLERGKIAGGGGGTRIIPLGPARGRPVNLQQPTMGVVGIGGRGGTSSGRNSDAAVSEFPLDSLLMMGEELEIGEKEKEVEACGPGKLILPRQLDSSVHAGGSGGGEAGRHTSYSEPGFVPGRVLYAPEIREFKPPVESRYQRGVMVGAENLRGVRPSEKKGKNAERKSKFGEEFLKPTSTMRDLHHNVQLASVPPAMRHPNSARASIWDIHPAFRQDLGVGPIDPYTTGAPPGEPAAGAWFPPPPMIPLRRIWSAPPGGSPSLSTVGADLEMGLGVGMAGALPVLYPPRPISDGYTAAAAATKRRDSTSTVSSRGSVHDQKRGSTGQLTVGGGQVPWAQGGAGGRGRWSAVDLNAPLPPLPPYPSPPLPQGRMPDAVTQDQGYVVRVGSVTRKPVPTPRLSIGIPMSPSSATTVTSPQSPSPVPISVPASPPLNSRASQSSLTYHKPRRSSNLASSFTAEDVERRRSQHIPTPQTAAAAVEQQLLISPVSRQTTFTEENEGESSGSGSGSGSGPLDPEKLLGLLQAAAEAVAERNQAQSGNNNDKKGNTQNTNTNPEMVQIVHQGSLIAGRPSISHPSSPAPPPPPSQHVHKPLQRNSTGGTRRRRRLSAPPSTLPLHPLLDDDTPPPPIPPRAEARLWRLASPPFQISGASIPPARTPPPPPPPINPARRSSANLSAVGISMVPPQPPIPPIPHHHNTNIPTQGTRTVSAPINPKSRLFVAPLTINKTSSSPISSSRNSSMSVGGTGGAGSSSNRNKNNAPGTPTTPISAARCIGSFTVSPVTGEVDVLKINASGSSESGSPTPPSSPPGTVPQGGGGLSRGGSGRGGTGSLYRKRSKSVGALPILRRGIDGERADDDEGDDFGGGIGEAIGGGVVRFDIARNEVFEAQYYGTWSTSTGSGTLGTGSSGFSGIVESVIGASGGVELGAGGVVPVTGSASGINPSVGVGDGAGVGSGDDEETTLRPGDDVGITSILNAFI
ncbi:hypothetical protein DFH27DRAFT_569491 [Peziza echinospora]|nr:hypothetical protein DFH27DRAFT_569491 [Peziza echinospora]